MSKIKPCPFCGDKKIKYSTSSFGPVNRKPIMALHNFDCINIKCCFTSTFADITKQEAIKRWNRRVNYSLLDVVNVNEID